jgi:hypothetical protein
MQPTILNTRDFEIMLKINWLHSNSQCIDLCFLKLNIGNKYGLYSELKKCPGMYPCPTMSSESNNRKKVFFPYRLEM